MATDILNVVNIVAYGLIPIGLFWIIIHYPSLRVLLFGLFVHMLIVMVRTTLRTVYPETAGWDWHDIHLTTATFSALAFAFGIWRGWRNHL